MVVVHGSSWPHSRAGTSGTLYALGSDPFELEECKVRACKGTDAEKKKKRRQASAPRESERERDIYLFNKSVRRERLRGACMR